MYQLLPFKLNKFIDLDGIKCQNAAANRMLTYLAVDKYTIYCQVSLVQRPKFKNANLSNKNLKLLINNCFNIFIFPIRD